MKLHNSVDANKILQCTEPTGSRILQSISQQPKLFCIHPNMESRVHRVGYEVLQSEQKEFLRIQWTYTLT